jgi:hypothetical protein
VYTDGFYIWNPKSEEMSPIRDTSNVVFIENTRAYNVDKISAIRKSIRFSNGNRLFRLNRIMYSDKDNLYVELKGSTGPAPIKSIKICTGIGEGRNELSFGQFLSDGVLELHDYHPMVALADGSYREVEREDYV